MNILFRIINIIKRYWLVIIIIIIAPVALNCLMLKPAIFKFVGKDTDWLNFWGAYIGVVISSAMAFYVLYKQLEQNHIENDKNRKLQMNILEHQQKTAWLADLKNRLIDYHFAFSQNDINKLANLYNSYSNKEHIMSEIKRLRDLMSAKSLGVEISFHDNTDEEEKKFVERLESHKDEFYALLKDLEWIAVFYDNDKVRSDKEKRTSTLQVYERDDKFNVKSKRIWYILNELHSDKERIDFTSIAKERIKEGIKEFEQDIIEKEIKDIVRYEQNKNDAILKS